MSANNDKTPFRCRLCGGGNATVRNLRRGGERLRYFRCRKCGLFNRDLVDGPAAEATDEFTADPAEDTAPENAARDRTYRFLERHLSPPGRVLDFGCGNGRLMLTARRGGWDVKGVERSPELAKRVRERLGAAVVVADLARLEPDAIDAVKFDVVCLHFGLERIADCVGTMTRLRALLTASGHALLELSMPRPTVIHGSDAVNLFARTPFNLLIERTGFDLVDWEPYADSPLATWASKFLPVGRFARALIRKQRR